MKRTFVALLLVASSAGAAGAVEINSTVTDSVQLTVEGAAVQMQRIGSSYSVTGNNITATTLGGLTGGSATAPATVSAGDYAITTLGLTFGFTETAIIGDTPGTSHGSLSATGSLDSLPAYGDSITSIGGTAGALAGSLNPSSAPSVTAGGPGTTAIAQRTIELTVLQ